MSWDNDRWKSMTTVRYRANGNGMEISIPRTDIGQANRTPAFDFHWADNIQRRTTSQNSAQMETVLPTGVGIIVSRLRTSHQIEPKLESEEIEPEHDANCGFSDF
jgi:hypothetical protein